MSNHNPFYVCNYYLLIFESKEKADSTATLRLVLTPLALTPAGFDAAAAVELSKHYSDELNSRVTFSNPNEPILFLKGEGKYWNVIIGEKIGWIIVEDWLNLRELKTLL